MAGSGHLSYYLYLYRNFYRFCNQGFESNNNRFRLTYLKCSNRGGHKKQSADEEEPVKQSHILGAIRPLYRSLFWWSGEGESFFSVFEAIGSIVSKVRRANPDAQEMDSAQYGEMSEVLDAVDEQRNVVTL